jgi:membrane protease YdiL (CAAX protease family)
MQIIKSFFYVLIYIALLSLLGSWVFLAYTPESLFILEYYDLINGLLLFFFLFLFTYMSNNENEKLPQSTAIKWYLIAAAIGALFVFVQWPLNWIYNCISVQQFVISYDFTGWDNFMNVNILSSILFIPIAEELFSRQFLQRKLHKKMNATKAITASALLFSFLHFLHFDFIHLEFYYNFHHAYITLIGGLLLALVYYKSKSIGPPIVLHMAWNIMVYIV